MTDQPTAPAPIPGNGPTIAGSPWLLEEPSTPTPPQEVTA